MVNARELWLQLNEKKFECPACAYNTCNGAHWTRHVQSTKHFLLYEFGCFAPMDIKVVVASFLPLPTILGLSDSVAWATLKRLYPTRNFFNRCQSSEGPHARTVFLGGLTRQNLRTLAFVL